MSLPRSKILSNVSKGFSAAADVSVNSPEQHQIVNVNVNTSSPDLLKNRDVEKTKGSAPGTMCHEKDKESNLPLNPYENVDVSDGAVNYAPSSETKTRSVATSTERLNELQAIIKSKDNIINAYSLILDILENNPLMINKYAVADYDSFTLLISYLTEADKVDIQESLDVDCSCTTTSKYIAIDKIYITKNNETQNFKYQYPNANKILDDHHISVKFVVDRTRQ